jgi:hypothetical protein
LLEWNFKKLLENKLIYLLQQQRAYWKQRGSIKWVTLGNAGTTFFHAHATIKYRSNYITQLVDDQGADLTDHNAKVDLIWHSFKERLGSSDYNGISFNLAQHLTVHPDLSSLVQPFSNEEVDAVVRHLPSNKAPGPDGFNTDFIEHCWSIISADFYQLCQSFFLWDSLLAKH